MGGPSDPGPASTPVVMVSGLYQLGSACGDALWISYTDNSGQLKTGSWNPDQGSFSQPFSIAAPCNITLTATWNADTSPVLYASYAVLSVSNTAGLLQVCAGYVTKTASFSVQLHCCFDSAGVPCACP